jgi:hypothetical protein
MTTYTMGDTLQVGTQLANGAIVLACTQIAERDPGETFAVWVAVCARSGKFHPFVVWNVIATHEGFFAQSGDYFHHIIEALGCFQNRGGSL